MLGIMFAACEKDESVYRIDPDEVLIIRGIDKVRIADGRRYKNTNKEYTVHECLVDSTLSLYMEAAGWWGFPPEAKDTINNRILMPANEIIATNADGTYRVVRELIDSEELIFCIGKWTDNINDPDIDTCGYIPQSVVRAARQKVDSLFAIEDYEGMVEVLHNDFIFHPCSGAEYKQLVANGEN